MNTEMASRCRPVVEPTKESQHHCKLKHYGRCGMSAIGACEFAGGVQLLFRDSNSSQLLEFFFEDALIFQKICIQRTVGSNRVWNSGFC
jgi:hypothetical protein